MSTSDVAFVTFKNSSAEDIESAKIFWKSVFLAPHHESNLVFDGMRQRLPTAPALVDKHGKIITQVGYHLPPILHSSNDQLRRSFGTWIENLHDQKYINEVNKHREETRLLLKKHRDERIKLEALAKQKTDNQM